MSVGKLLEKEYLPTNGFPIEIERDEFRLVFGLVDCNLLPIVLSGEKYFGFHRVRSDQTEEILLRRMRGKV